MAAWPLARTAVSGGSPPGACPSADPSFYSDACCPHPALRARWPPQHGVGASLSALGGPASHTGSLQVGSGPRVLQGGEADAPLRQQPPHPGRHGHDHLRLPHGYVRPAGLGRRSPSSRRQAAGTPLQPRWGEGPRSLPRPRFYFVVRTRRGGGQTWGGREAPLGPSAALAVVGRVSPRKHGPPPLRDLREVRERDVHHPLGQRKGVSPAAAAAARPPPPWVPAQTGGRVSPKARSVPCDSSPPNPRSNRGSWALSRPRVAAGKLGPGEAAGQGAGRGIYPTSRHPGRAHGDKRPLPGPRGRVIPSWRVGKGVCGQGPRSDGQSCEGSVPQRNRLWVPGRSRVGVLGSQPSQVLPH